MDGWAEQPGVGGLPAWVIHPLRSPGPMVEVLHGDGGDRHRLGRVPRGQGVARVQVQAGRFT